MKKLVGLILFFLNFTLFSQPNQIAIQGILKDSNGNKVNGKFSMTFNFYNSADAESPIYGFTPSEKVEVVNGEFNVIIDLLTQEIFKDYSEIWCGVTVAGEKEFPRIKIVSVGYAIRAKYADTLLSPPTSVACTGCIGSNEIADGSISGIKIADNTIGNDKISSLSWSKLTDIPTGFADGVDNEGITGTGNLSYIPKFSDSNVLTDSIISEKDEKIGVGTSSPVVKLDVNGGIKIAQSNVECNSSTAGTIKFENSHFYGCNGANWVMLDSVNTNPNPTDITITMENNVRMWSNGTYAKSCYEYKNPSSPGYSYSGQIGDGVYRIDPDGAGPIAPFDVYCDMTTDGGGWTLCGWIDEVAANNNHLVIKESDQYISYSNLKNKSFCAKWYKEQSPRALLVHNLTPGEDYGYNQKVKIEWGNSPFTLYNYSENHPIQLCKNLTTGKVYSGCQYSAHSGWEDTSFSFTVGNLNTGYTFHANQRLILGPTTSPTGNKDWHNFGADSNTQNITNYWSNGYNKGFIYLR